MTMLLSLRLWLAIALAALLVFTHAKAYKGGQADVMQQWTAEKLAASEATRQREKFLTIANQGVDRALQDDKLRRAAVERANAASLRDLQATLADRNADTPTTSGTDEPYRAIASECAGVVQQLDSYAAGLAGKAAALQGYARDVCLSTVGK